MGAYSRGGGLNRCNTVSQNALLEEAGGGQGISYSCINHAVFQKSRRHQMKTNRSIYFLFHFTLERKSLYTSILLFYKL